VAVNSKADKTGSHKVLKGSQPKPSFTAGPAQNTGTVLGTAGTKALLFRARKELGPLEDPTQPVSE
jgi:hypothetical protein